MATDLDTRTAAVPRIIVGIGVLLDTLLVCTIVVPALVHVLGDRFWAPGRLRPRS